MPTADATHSEDLHALVRSWTRSLRARNLSPKTVRTYGDSALQFAAHVSAHAPDVAPADLQRRHVEEFLADLAGRAAAATVSVRYRGLQQFFGWMVDEEEIARSPMERMRTPEVPEQPVPVVALADARELLAACEGKGFAERRDTAVIRLFLDTGMRLSELAGLTLNDLDLDLDVNVALVLGKGRRQRGRHRRLAPAPVPPHLRPRVAVGGRQRRRPDAPGRLALAADAQSLRRQRGGPARPRRPPPPGPRRPPVRCYR